MLLLAFVLLLLLFLLQGVMTMAMMMTTRARRRRRGRRERVDGCSVPPAVPTCWRSHGPILAPALLSLAALALVQTLALVCGQTGTNGQLEGSPAVRALVLLAYVPQTPHMSPTASPNVSGLGLGTVGLGE